MKRSNELYKHQIMYNIFSMCSFPKAYHVGINKQFSAWTDSELYEGDTKVKINYTKLT